jgi:hypothetical protein
MPEIIFGKRYSRRQAIGLSGNHPESTFEAGVTFPARYSKKQGIDSGTSSSAKWYHD